MEGNNFLNYLRRAPYCGEIGTKDPRFIIAEILWSWGTYGVEVSLPETGEYRVPNIFDNKKVTFRLKILILRKQRF